MSQVLEFASTVVKNLPEISEEMRCWWISNPLELQAFLAGLSKKPSLKLDIFKTIRLGTGLKTADDFRKSLEGNGNRISNWANDILGKPEFFVTDKEMEVDLVVVSVAELGFRKGARRDQIYDRAKELGLQLCPPDVGPQLRLQYADQPMNEWLLIGMEPIRFSGGYLGVFRVVHGGGGLWLYGYGDYPGSVWDAGDRWVFVRPRKCQNQS